MDKSETTRQPGLPGKRRRGNPRETRLAMLWHRKVWLIAVLALAAWLVTFHTVSSRVILSRFIRLEQQKAALNVRRAGDALYSQIELLDAKARDWAHWDDSLAFVQGRNPQFVAKNLATETLEQLDVDLLAFVGPANQVILTRARDARTGEAAAFPPSLLNRLSQGDLLIQHASVESRHKGLVMLPEGSLLVASRPILNSHGEGPISGVLLLGRYVNPREIGTQARLTRNTVSLCRIDDANLPADAVKAIEALQVSEDILACPLNDDLIGAYMLVKDVYENPALLLRLEVRQDIYAEGRATVNQFFLTMLIICVTFVSVLWILLQRIVLEQLAARETLERHLAIVVESCDDAILSETLDGVITSWNHGAEEVFGYSPRQAVGKSMRMLVPSERWQEESDILARIERGQTVDHFETVRLRQDGRRIEVAVTVSAIRDTHGRVVGVSCIARDVTERNQAQKKLQAEEAKYRTLFESSHDAIMTLEPPTWQFTSGNPAAVKMFGAKTEKELTAFGPAELSCDRQPDGRPALEKSREMLQTALLAGSHSFEWMHRGIDGEEFPANVLLTKMEWEGKPVIQATVRDITERKRMERMREKSLERQEQMNRLQQALLDPGELAPKLKMITDAVVDIFGADFCRIWCINAGDLCEQGCMHVHAKGQSHECRDRNRCLHLLASSGRYTHTDGLVHRRIPFGAYKIGTLASGQEHEFITNNVGQDPRVHNQAWARELGLVSFAGYQVRPRGGDTLGVLALFSKHVITPEEDAQLRSLSSTTARVIQAARAEEALSRNEERYRTVSEHTYDWEFWRMPDGRLTYCSPSCERISGYRSEEYCSDPDLLRRIVHADDLPVWDQHIATSSQSSETHAVDYRIVTREGDTCWVAHVCSPVYASDGAYLGRRGSNRDITKRKLSEEAMRRAYEELAAANAKLLTMQSQLVQNEKLASIGQLAAGVAHEMNTPVGFVASNFETLESYLRKIRDLLALYEKTTRQAPSAENAGLQALLNEIEQFRREKRIDFILEDVEALFEDSREGLKRVTSIIQNLRDFSRVDRPGSRDEYDLNKGIEATLVVARNEIKYDADVQTEFSDLPRIFCHGGQINQVLLNILVNAAQAIKSQKREAKGTITIRTRACEDGVVCEIADDGPGIAPEHIGKVFDPFFTTKPPGKGTGLGLSVSHDIIVHKHGGKLSVESTPGKGTTFTIELPIGVREDAPKEPANQELEGRVLCGR